MDKTNTDLNRYIKPQNDDYAQALSEIQNGKKRSHWMWYIFPQYKGLGFSETSKYYSIQNRDEAIAYLNHPILGARLKEISNELLKLEQTDAKSIFGSPDYLKLKSSMTLFAEVEEARDNVFKKVIDKFYHGKEDDKTLQLLQDSIH